MRVSSMVQPSVQLIGPPHEVRRQRESKIFRGLLIHGQPDAIRWHAHRNGAIGTFEYFLSHDGRLSANVFGINGETGQGSVSYEFRRKPDDRHILIEGRAQYESDRFFRQYGAIGHQPQSLDFWEKRSDGARQFLFGMDFVLDQFEAKPSGDATRFLNKRSGLLGIVEHTKLFEVRDERVDGVELALDGHAQTDAGQVRSPKIVLLRVEHHAVDDGDIDKLDLGRQRGFQSNGDDQGRVGRTNFA